MNAVPHRRSPHAVPESRQRWRWLPALLVLHVVLALPDHPSTVGWETLLRLPVELPIVVLILLACPPRRWPLVRATMAAVLGAIVLTKLADIATHAALGRRFHPMLDLNLVGASFELLAAALGVTGAVALTVAAALAGIASVALVYRAIGALRFPDRRRGRLAAAAALSAIVVGAAHWSAFGGFTPAITAADTSRSVHGHLQMFRDGLADRARFQAELADDPFVNVDSHGLLAGLRGIDVVFLFVESYGRTTLEKLPYAPTVQRALEEFEQTVRAAGFDMRSAWVTAPVHGGQSWLSHATLLSGARIDNQRRWESLLVSERQTLADDFGRAGWRTLCVQPATERPWPEGRFFGFDRIYAAKDLGYAGEPFNWVTMPDQYTLSALQRLEFDRRGRSAVMAVVALISSHAPWTPLPLVLDWEAVGDGAVFTHARKGDPPPVVWLDAERVRAQYLLSIEYVLRTLQSWVVAYGRDDVLYVVVGDHQPARIVSDDDDSLDVPIHLLARESRLLDAFADGGWSSGMRPNATAPVWPMETIRGRFLDAFTGPSF